MRVRGEREHDGPSCWPSSLFVWRFAVLGDLLSFSKKNEAIIVSYTYFDEILVTGDSKCVSCSLFPCALMMYYRFSREFRTSHISSPQHS